MDEKRPHRANPQPIISATEAWLLSRAQALTSLAASIEKMKPQAIAAEIAALTDAAWAQYFKHVDAPPAVQAQRASILADLDPETAIPVVEWPATEETRVGVWEFVDLGKTEGLDLTMTVPFRPVSLASLPEGTRVVPLQDPRHSAAAAMIEALTSAKRDITAAFTAVSPVTAFRRLNRVIQVYRQAARITLAKLQTDDFHTWQPNAPRTISLAQAEALICQLGATARSHQVLAVHLMAQWLQHLADDETISRAPDRKEAVMGELMAMIAKFNRTLEHYSRQSSEDAGITHETYAAMVIFHPVPGTGPVIAFVPAGGPNTESVVPFPSRAGRARKAQA